MGRSRASTVGAGALSGPGSANMAAAMAVAATAVAATEVDLNNFLAKFGEYERY